MMVLYGRSGMILDISHDSSAPEVFALEHGDPSLLFSCSATWTSPRKDIGILV